MSKNFFQSGAFLGNGLSRFALNSDPVQLMESARASAEPPTDPVINNNPEPAAQTNDNVPSAQAPEQILEGKDGKEWTVEQAHQMILEAANRSAMQNALSDAADAVFAWADSGDLTFDSLMVSFRLSLVSLMTTTPKLQKNRTMPITKHGQMLLTSSQHAV